MAVECVCEHCGATFLVKPYRLERYNVRFCSRSCLGKAKINETARLAAITGKRAANNRQVDFLCGWCGCSFSDSPSRRRKYCSSECRGFAKRCGTGYLHTKRNGREVKAHRLVMEAHLGRPLLAHEDVHHINENKRDNRVENLAVMTRAEHARLHHRLRATSSDSDLPA